MMAATLFSYFVGCGRALGGSKGVTNPKLLTPARSQGRNSPHFFVTIRLGKNIFTGVVARTS